MDTANDRKEFENLIMTGDSRREFPEKSKDDGKPKPKIIVAGVYDRSEQNLRKKTGGVDPSKEINYRTEEIVPGMIIERNGRLYRVDAKGTQRRVKT